MANQHTAKQSRVGAREEFVSVFDFRKSLKDIAESVQKLKDYSTPVKAEDFESIEDFVQAAAASVPSSAAVGAAKAVAEINLRLLNKLIPDVKAIEVTGEGGGDIMTAVKVQLVSASSDKNDTDT